MKMVDLSGLIKGLMVVIGIAIALGKYDQLAAWARREAAVAITVVPERRTHRQPHGSVETTPLRFGTARAR